MSFIVLGLMVCERLLVNIPSSLQLGTGVTNTLAPFHPRPAPLPSVTVLDPGYPLDHCTPERPLLSPSSALSPPHSPYTPTPTATPLQGIIGLGLVK